MENYNIKNIAPYLPYKVVIFVQDYKSNYIGKKFSEVIGLHQWDNEGKYWSVLTEHGSKTSLNDAKLVLRPLTDLFNGNYEDILDEFSEVSLEAFKIAFMSDLKPLNAFDKLNYTVAVKLFKNHFDLFSLIEKGEAIDINTLKDDLEYKQRL